MSTQDSPAEPAGHHVGSLAAEAGLLVDVLLARLERSASYDASQVCTGCGRPLGARCTAGCPLCAVVAVVRGEPADIPPSVMEPMKAALTAIRDWVSSPGGTTADEPAETKPADGAFLQRIDITP